MLVGKQGTLERQKSMTGWEEDTGSRGSLRARTPWYSELDGGASLGDREGASLLKQQKERRQQTS